MIAQLLGVSVNGGQSPVFLRPTVKSVRMLSPECGGLLRASLSSRLDPANPPAQHIPNSGRTNAFRGAA